MGPSKRIGLINWIELPLKIGPHSKNFWCFIFGRCNRSRYSVQSRPWVGLVMCCLISSKLSYFCSVMKVESKKSLFSLSRFGSLFFPTKLIQSSSSSCTLLEKKCFLFYGKNTGRTQQVEGVYIRRCEFKPKPVFVILSLSWMQDHCRKMKTFISYS